jgi:hypothetical protein
LQETGARRVRLANMLTVRTAISGGGTDLNPTCIPAAAARAPNHGAAEKVVLLVVCDETREANLCRLGFRLPATTVAALSPGQIASKTRVPVTLAHLPGIPAV